MSASTVVTAFHALIGLASGILTIHSFVELHPHPKIKQSPITVSMIVVGIIFILSLVLAPIMFFLGRASASQPLSIVHNPTPTPSLAATFAPTSVSTQTPTPTSALGIDTLTDDFNSVSGLDTTKWWRFPSNGATVAVSGGQLLTISAKNIISSLAAIDSNMLYSAIGQSAFIQVLQVASGTVDTSFGLQNSDGTDAIQIYYSRGNLEVGTYKEGEHLFTTAYNSSTQKWWRIRESGGTTYADISSDGVTWTNIYAHAIFFNMSQVRVAIGSYEWAADPTAGVAKFANFNRN
jgi:hypothetical protein